MQVRPWMLRKGVSEFEKFAAEKDLKVPYEAISRLYQVCAAFGGMGGGGGVRNEGNLMRHGGMRNGRWVGASGGPCMIWRTLPIPYGGVDWLMRGTTSCNAHIYGPSLLPHGI